MSSWAIETLRRVATDLRRCEDGRIPQDAADAFLLGLETAYRELLVEELLDGHSFDAAGALLRAAIQNLRMVQTETQATPPLFPPTTYTGHVGRPKFDVPQHQLATLLESGFTCPQIASIVGFSLSTVRQRMAEFGLSVSDQYSHISNDDLDMLVRGIKEQFPTCGNKQMQGHLHSRGYRIQQIQVREAIMRVDPARSVMRRLRALNRRKYHVPGPRSLCHMDSYHKLIRYNHLYK